MKSSVLLQSDYTSFQLAAYSYVCTCPIKNFFLFFMVVRVFDVGVYSVKP